MRRIALLTLLFCAAAAAPAAAADETLAQLDDPTPVDAFGGRLVWSEKLPGKDRFQLMTKTDGNPAHPAAAVPVPSAPGPFQVDLGRGPGGSMTAVYPRHGDIYAFDFASGHERRLLHTAKARESLPAIWRARLAFVRGKQLFMRSGGKLRAVHGGRGAYRQIDLRGGRVAFVRERIVRNGDGRELQLLTQQGHGVARLVRRSRSGLLSRVAIRKPALRSGAMFYAVTRFGAAGNDFFRYDLSTRRSRQATGRRNLMSAAYDGGRFLYEMAPFEQEACHVADEPANCTLALTSPVTF
jgi:hypothetical protein